jgi:chorismate dehydratase
MREIDLRIDHPSGIAEMLLRDDIDMGLVPVAIIPQMKEYHVNGDVCIGSDGPVASVCLFSEVPVGEIETVLLDYQSRTSVQLARILLEKYWKVKPDLIDGGKDFRDHIRGTTAGVVIGDRALGQRKLSPYVYDLGQAWKDMTGLPFVFAAWISNKELDPRFIERFNEANKMGLKHLEEVIKENPFEAFDLRQYFNQNLDYRLDDAKRKGMETFLHYLSNGQERVQSPVTGSYNTSLITGLEVSRIVDLYMKEQHLDVKKYFRGLSSIQLRKCNDTGYRFYYPMDTYGDDAFYQHLQQTGIYYLKEKWEYDKAAALIGENRRVLEIGSGAGDFMRKLNDASHTRLCGLELNTMQVEMARKEGLDVINETIEDFAFKNPGTFDVVVALQVLEHIPEVRPFILSSLEALKTGGQLIICVPHNNPYLYRHDLFHTLNLPPHHAGLWDRRSFASLPDHFPMRLGRVYIEPLSDYKKWYEVQLAHLKERRHPLWRLLSSVPAPVYKNFLRAMRYFMEGRNILVEFIKI